MSIVVNDELKKYIEASGKVVLNACPGSGKTTAIAIKLIELLKKNEHLSNQHSGIACLSFTNTAKDEIADSFYKLSNNILRYPHIVSTIDSFINQYITLPFYYLICNSVRPKILEKDDILDDIFENKLYAYKSNDQKPLCFIYKPSSIKIEKNNDFTINGKIPSTEKVKEETFKQYCKHIKGWQKRTGLLTNDDSAFFALYLLNKYPRIGKYLALRFKHIIIDEAQDTSEIQYAIFDKLIDAGLSNIEFVGDPYQSLYEWREATPSLFLERCKLWNGLELTKNRRSSQYIIDAFSIIRKKDDYNIISDSNSINIPLLIYKYKLNFKNIISHYEKQCEDSGFQNNQIVVRGNSLKNTIMGNNISYQPWNNTVPYQIIEAKTSTLKGDIKNAIKIIRKLYVVLFYHDKDHSTRRVIEDEISYNASFNALFLEILSNLPTFDLSIKEWTSKSQLYIKEHFKLNYDLDFSIKSRNSQNFNKKILNESINFCFAKEVHEYKTLLTTIHQVKGKSLDSILIVFNNRVHKENITFHDIIETNKHFPSEKQRLIYVAMSRPRYLLAMAFPHNISNDEIIQKFGNNLNIVDINE